MNNLDAKLIKMGEQIVANCSFSNDQEVVINKVADHLQRFWDPRMRTAIKENLAFSPDAASDVLRHAVNKISI